MTHGTLSGYAKSRCRCDDCRECWRAYARDYYRRNQAVPRVSADEARARLLALAAKGITPGLIARSCKLSRTTVREIRDGRRTTIRPQQQKAILSCRPRHRRSDGLVDSWPARRGVLCLLREGYARAGIAGRLGTTRSGLCALLRRRRIRRATESKVRELCERIQRERLVTL